MAKGLFIVFEGCEGSGKSTQAELLQTALLESGRQAILVHEPGSTNLGRYLRNYLKSKQPLTKEAELLLFRGCPSPVSSGRNPAGSGQRADRDCRPIRGVHAGIPRVWTRDRHWPDK